MPRNWSGGGTNAPMSYWMSEGMVDAEGGVLPPAPLPLLPLPPLPLPSLPLPLPPLPLPLLPLPLPPSRARIGAIDNFSSRPNVEATAAVLAPVVSIRRRLTPWRVGAAFGVGSFFREEAARGEGFVI